MNERLQFWPGWFQTPGAYVLVDGQYGSTGKGVIAAHLAHIFADQCDLVANNAGPNSGHTFYHKPTSAPTVLKQLPTFAVAAAKDGIAIPVYLTAGAIVDPVILEREIYQNEIIPSMVRVHPHAALIYNHLKEQDKLNVTRVASTGQGVGPAMVAKLGRDPMAVYGGDSVGLFTRAQATYFQGKRTFFEVSQGFSLGINSGFYPTCTTRECTVSQALCDAGLPPSFHRKTVMTMRTFPIRVGNTENSSGGHYFDQKELTWAELKQTPELTTVTKRVRRVFTWSRAQFGDALLANDPDALFINFMNYLPEEDHVRFIKEEILDVYESVLRRRCETLTLGYGPTDDDVRYWDGNKVVSV